MTGYRHSFRKPWFVAARTTETKATKEREEIMKKIVAIVLISFLGFLGCSGSDDATSTFNTFNGQTIPVEPFGIQNTMTPTYGWTPVQYATRYHLLVQEAIEGSNIQDTTETYVIDEWYTAEEAGCISEEDLCIVTPDIDVDGTFIWKVLACAGEECGTWSDDLQFSYPPPTTPRFTDNGDGTVTDNYTGLMWTQDANLYGENDWWDATSYCWDLTLANHSNWRLPNISELNSLIDETQEDPALPPDNPFTNVQSGFYWSSITNAYLTDVAWGVHFSNGSVGYGDKNDDNDVCCVRGEGKGDYPEPVVCDSCEGDVNAKATQFVYFDEVVNGYLKPKDVQFNQRSYGHVCKSVEVGVQRIGVLIAKMTDCRGDSTQPVNWIKNNVIGGGWPPPAYEQRYLISYYYQTSFKYHPIPDKFRFVVWGDLIIYDFKGAGTYKCEAVMLGWTNAQSLTLHSEGFTFITNSASSKCYSKEPQVFQKKTQSMPLECRHITTGEPRLFKVSRWAHPRASPNHFLLEWCNE